MRLQEDAGVVAKTPEEIFANLQKFTFSVVENTNNFGGELDKIIGDKLMLVFRHQRFETCSGVACTSAHAAL